MRLVVVVVAVTFETFCKIFSVFVLMRKEDILTSYILSSTRGFCQEPLNNVVVVPTNYCAVLRYNDSSYNSQKNEHFINTKSEITVIQTHQLSYE